MKIKVNDLEHILKQIRNIENPTTKEHSKVLNALKIFLEDNTDIQDPAILKIKQEYLVNKFYNLSKTRREEPKGHKEEFRKFINKLKEDLFITIEDKKEDYSIEHSSQHHYDLFEEFKNINEESQNVSEKIDMITSDLCSKETKKTDNTKTIINYFRTL